MGQQNNPNRQPAVSIIIPVFNRPALLRRAVESVICQTFTDWELIVVDDGSTDETFDSACNLSRRNSSIRILRQPHGGPSKALNLGRTAARAPIVTTLDSDDYYLPNHLEINLALMTHLPEIDLLIGKTTILGDPFVMDVENPGQKIHIDQCVSGGTFFMRRAVLDSIGGWPDAGYGSDFLLRQSAERAGHRIHRHEGRTYVYDRRGDDSITKNEEKRAIP